MLGIGLSSHSVKLWNVYHLTLNGYPRPNNAVEAWYNDIMVMFGIYHPKILKFIDGIKQEQDANIEFCY